MNAVKEYPGTTGETLPKVLDPVVTMELVQRYVEAERKRNTRILFMFTGASLFVVLLMLGLFFSLGLVIMRTSRAAANIAKDTETATQLVATQITNMVTRLADIEKGHVEVGKIAADAKTEFYDYRSALETDLSRFRAWIADNDKTSKEQMAQLREQLDTMNTLLQAAEKERVAVREAFETHPVFTRDDDGEVKMSPASSGNQDDFDDYISSIVQETADPGTTIKPSEISLGTEAFDSDIVKPAGMNDPVSIVKFPNGDAYSGMFKNGLFHGWGTYTYNNGDRYEGMFREDMKDGKGTFYYKDGSKYVGDFLRDVKHGRGTMFMKNGDRYSGEFNNDNMTGKGVLIYASGQKYEGDVVNGLKHGNGSLYFKNGDVYVGEFKDDLREGQGSYTFADGGKYIGGFKDGQRHGKGRRIYATGDEYIGEFKNGLKDGRGICIYSNGLRLKGVWRNDKFVAHVED